jgi:predicted Fe-Mo cluster-binding NifX family protein
MMRIAVTAEGSELTSPVDPHFGRAKQFLIVDTDTNEVEVVDNAQNLNAAQGAGIQAARTVSQLGVEAVLTGNCGPNAFRTLAAAGVKIYIGITGSVAEAVEQFKAGQLALAEDANVQGRWGMT